MCLDSDYLNRVFPSTTTARTAHEPNRSLVRVRLGLGFRVGVVVVVSRSRKLHHRREKNIPYRLVTKPYLIETASYDSGTKTPHKEQSRDKTRTSLKQHCFARAQNECRACTGKYAAAGQDNSELAARRVGSFSPPLLYESYRCVVVLAPYFAES